MARPWTCPVCFGVGWKQSGFYVLIQKSDGKAEQCQSCVKGVIWEADTYIPTPLEIEEGSVKRCVCKQGAVGANVFCPIHNPYASVNVNEDK